MNHILKGHEETRWLLKARQIEALPGRKNTEMRVWKPEKLRAFGASGKIL